MSRWEQHEAIDGEINADGELMISISDTIAWIRACADGWTDHPCHANAATAIADSLLQHWIDTTSNLVDGSGS
ncbi:hypothetical protein [Nocardioides sp.]|uniref:hypothetical protein n=1 Tax=Nocardioides sp. TaxID=35761 RepID=UPI0035AED746